MAFEFKSGLEYFKARLETPRLTTRSPELDFLLGGGMEPGHFYLFYGDQDSGVDLLIHRVLSNCVLPEGQGGLNGRAVYLNCGNYREEKTLLDPSLLGSFLKASGLNPKMGLGKIHVFCAFSEGQEEQVVSSVEKLLREARDVKLLVVHNISKLFVSETGTPNRNLGDRIPRLQGVVLKLIQACVAKNVALVASCRPTKTRKGGYPQPEGGKYLRHEANVMIYLRAQGSGEGWFTAYLIKHPNSPPRKINFHFDVSQRRLGDATSSYGKLVRDEVEHLKKSFQSVLRDDPRRQAFHSLVKSWCNEEKAMDKAQAPTVLDIMLLTAVVDNRKHIQDLFSQVGGVKADVEKIRGYLERLVSIAEKG